MKKKQVNRSELIREHLKTAKDKSPVAVVKALKSKGVTVSRGLVSVVKHSRMKKKTFTFSATGLVSARRFVKQAGSIEEAKNLLEVVRRIIS